jgi:hypothetical protein
MSDYTGLLSRLPVVARSTFVHLRGLAKLILTVSRTTMDGGFNRSETTPNAFRDSGKGGATQDGNVTVSE